ncbi:MAG: hypothetical protein IT370_00935 [Deltaproteobacteria bacterium]|nr:hypothetical protein [Deltaproteobacteria bacterium]
MRHWLRPALPLIIILLPFAFTACSAAPDAPTAPASSASAAHRLSAGALLAITPVNSVVMLTVAPRRAALAVTGGRADLVLQDGALHLGALDVDIHERALTPAMAVHDVHVSLDAPSSARASIAADGRVSADLPATLLLDYTVDQDGQPGQRRHERLAATLHLEVTLAADGRTNAAVTARETHEFAGQAVDLLLAVRAIE